MPVAADTVTLVANTRSDNVMANRNYRLLPRGAAIKLSVTGNTNTVKARLFVGGALLADDALVNNRATAPVEPDDILIPWTRVPGGEVILTFISPTADVVRWKLDVM